ncbi:DUF4054 domain-containing protein [Cloacibacillus sp. An23]|uniref:DUF4054 domain-containing protein n=1 Tax=Cloacibacillus sp. An23 TaxID=1965591 RepID=UPI000B3A82E8|nr:DUF4054 domain-containing protein [Cloacibacillus sp. An23]OUO94800.1 hypothetical protein B5F39_02725 [Cloacibacillus sp. An23]
MAVISFDIAAFRAAYPQFADISDEQLQGFWDVACIISGLNRDGSVISDLDARQVILFMLVCHLATLYQRGAVVGPLTSATEGSVSSGFAAPPYTLQNWWYLQTPCGAAYWEAMRPYRVGVRYYAYKGC